MGDSSLTVDELFATLSHSFLPTVVVEGNDDLIVFRRLEQEFASVDLSVFPVGGRENVLGLFDKKAMLPNEHNFAFIADLDSWIVTGVPTKYQSDRLLFTTGYSIENDIIVDGALEDYFSKEERHKFSQELSVFTDWYALAFSRFLNDSTQSFDLHPNQVFDNEAKIKELMTLAEGEEYPQDLRLQFIENYKSQIRGKSLFALIMRQLSYKGRPVRHHGKSLMEVVAVARGSLLNTFYARIENIFRGKQPNC